MHVLLAFTFFAGVVYAQAPFEVSTIKPSGQPDGRMRMQFAGPQFRADGYTLKGLVQFAYDLQEYQVSDGPAWIDKDRFDLNAKVPDGVDNGGATNRVRLQTLLADRFKLSVHKETRQATILVLMVNKGGPKLTAATQEGPTGSSSLLGQIKVTSGQLSLLARLLASRLGQQVVDRTGLDGKYDFELKWEADQAKGEGPSVFTALQEQLGLKLDSEKGPLEVLVVDRAERPTDN